MFYGEYNYWKEFYNYLYLTKHTNVIHSIDNVYKNNIIKNRKEG